MNRFPLVTALAITVLGVIAGNTHTARAQGTPTTLVIPAGTLSATAERLGWIDVYGNGELCGRVVFVPGGDASVQEHTLALDGPGKPVECATNGARLTFIDGRGHLLYRSLIVAAGQANVLDSLPPSPPTDPGPGAFSVMIIAISHQVRERADTSLGIHFIDAYADGVFCLAWRMGPDGWLALNGDTVIGLGKPDQPAACARDGALITLRTRADESGGEGAFLAGLRLVPGATYQLVSVAPPILRDQRDVRPPDVGTGLALRPTPSPVLPAGFVLAALGAAGLCVTRRGPRQA